MPKIITYNVNGIRAAMTKNWLDWLNAVNPDIVCLQETKASPEQLDTGIFEDAGYHHYWHSAEKKGYSGVAIFTKNKPDHIEIGCGIDHIDAEGRIIRADYGDKSVISLYIPSGSSGDERQAYKMEWLEEFYDYIHNLKKEHPNLLICGDYNICHKAIDIHNPISNAKSSGFLPEEREWMSKFIDSGFIDSFRYFNQEPHQYTWWSYRANARVKNLGWRIDYIMATQNLGENLKRAIILPDAKHSDHCPMLLDIDF
jgi:exodeoxyribonuclease III